MPSTSPATEIDVDAIASEVYAARDRIVVLLKEGNTEAAAELSKEAETIISNNLKGSTRNIMQLKKTLRGAIADAMKTAPIPAAEVREGEVITSTEVALANAAAVAENVAEIDALVAKGAEMVGSIADSNLNGPRRIAEIQLDIWRRMVDAEGRPDILGTSKPAKAKAKEIFTRVLGSLAPKGENDAADVARAQITKLMKNTENARVNVRALMLTGLDADTEDAAAERERYASLINPEDARPASEQVALGYGSLALLKTQAELAKENRERKAAEAAAKPELTEGGEGEDVTAREAAAEFAGLTPAAKVVELVKAMQRSLSLMGETDPEAYAESLAEMDTEARAKLAEEANEAVERLNALLDMIEA